MLAANRVKKQTARVILTLVVALVFMAGVCITGCASSKPQSTEEQTRANAADLRESLKDTVKDPGRLQQMLAITDQAAVDLETRATKLATLLKEQDLLNTNYNASKDEFRQLGDRMLTVRKEMRSKVISTRQALAQLATDDEWKKITSRDLAILGN
jgi:hypothetical protein